MNSEDLSIIAVEPFIRKFVFGIIQKIRSQNFSYKEKQVIHADLVPRISEKVMESSLMKEEIPFVKELMVPINKPVTKTPIKIPVREIPIPSSPAHFSQKSSGSLPISPKQKPVFSSVVKLHLQKPTFSPQPLRMQPASHQIITSNVPIGMEFHQDYGKVIPLLNDPSISLIECQGAGTPLMIIRAGQRQITRITLSPEEIKGILQKASDTSHIPLLEGVFRVVVDNFSINAIISEMIGSRFVIRKQTPYSLLERQV